MDVQGQPQNLRNKSIVGRPLASGKGNLACDCARSPICGGLRTGFCGGGGVCHDCSALGTPHCTFAKGFAKPAAASSAAAFPFFELGLLLPKKLSVLGSETLPNPALRRASLVPSELSMLLVLCAGVGVASISRRAGYRQGERRMQRGQTGCTVGPWERACGCGCSR